MWDPISNKDPMGLYSCDLKGDETNCNAFEDSRLKLVEASKSDNISSADRATLGKIVDFIGTKNDDKKVAVSFGDTKGIAEAGSDGKNTTLKFDMGQMSERFKDAGER